MHSLTQERIKEYVKYDPETGVFTRLKTYGRSGVRTPTKGTMDSSGYYVINICGVKKRSHQMAFIYMTGITPEFVDHINGDRSDNRWCNLRTATNGQNSMNSKRNKSNKSGVKGVWWDKVNKKWAGRVVADGKNYNVGRFPDLIGAEIAVRKKRIELHGEFANHGYGD